MPETSTTPPSRGPIAALREVVDLRTATAGAVVMGAAVFAINARLDLGGAATAAAKQATWTFLAGGVLTRLCERLAAHGPSRARALAVATAIPSALALGFTLLVHLARGTPDPFASVLPTALVAPPSFLAWAARARRGMGA